MLEKKEHNIKEIQQINNQFLSLIRELKKSRFEESCFFVETAYCSFEQALAYLLAKKKQSI